MKTPHNLKNVAAVPDQTLPTFAMPWRILVVDDKEDVHNLAVAVLAKIIFKQRRVESLNVYSARQAEQILKTETNIAVILLAVEMETEDASLKLLQMIRKHHNNNTMQIILRTAQPEQAPEESLIVDYDIHDYQAISQLTAQTLLTSLMACLRSYDGLMSLEKNRLGLEKILQSSDSLFQIHSLREFASGVLTLVSSFLDCSPGGIICLEENAEVEMPATPSSLIFSGRVRLLATTGEYSGCLDCQMGEHCFHLEIVEHILRALDERKSQFVENYTVLYLEAGDHKATVALMTCGLSVDESDRQLLSVFALKISIALANAMHYQKMLSFEEAATTDFLTGLNNRRQLLRLGATLLAGANRHQTTLAVALIDIDYFKRVNDNYGHDVGDIVIKQLGEGLKKRFRASDIVARYGGEEFCVIVPQLSRFQAFELFDSFRMTIAGQAIEIGQGRVLKITVSIGISTELCKSLNEMISRADELLYTAKQAGRNCIAISA